jgi:hypothetical protein
MSSRAEKRYRFILDAIILLCMIIVVSGNVYLLNGATNEQEQHVPRVNQADVLERGASVSVQYHQEIDGKGCESIPCESKDDKSHTAYNSGGLGADVSD